MIKNTEFATQSEKKKYWTKKLWKHRRCHHPLLTEEDVQGMMIENILGNVLYVRNSFVKGHKRRHNLFLIQIDPVAKEGVYAKIPDKLQSLINYREPEYRFMQMCLFCEESAHPPFFKAECYSNHPLVGWGAITSPNDFSTLPPKCISFSLYSNETLRINFE
ncbi:hypothetical protein NPIL_367531 [Nephila pilipes]|uniref:Uncharacterized protein n=1 Tax=Nephila pilipes TaxID=299642 RepID=A0A8X6N1Z7_NEPPI|nr:hypothetical protein NPIL_367531 [Nephila pilipes]